MPFGSARDSAPCVLLALPRSRRSPQRADDGAFDHEASGGGEPAGGEPAGAAADRTAPYGLQVVPARLPEEYLRHEGPGHRGKWFAQLAGCLFHLSRDDPPVTELETLEVLGRPDYGGSYPQGARFVYVYVNEALKRDEVMFFDFNADGLLTLFF